MTVFAKVSTPDGIVALKSDFWMLVFVQAAKISSICSKKPSSNNLSASSRTRCRTLVKKSCQHKSFYTTLLCLATYRLRSISSLCIAWTKRNGVLIRISRVTSQYDVARKYSHYCCKAYQISVEVLDPVLALQLLPLSTCKFWTFCQRWYAWSLGRSFRHTLLVPVSHQNESTQLVITVPVEPIHE